MKKTIVLFAGIALMTAGCTKTEVIRSGTEGTQKGIGFSAYTAKPTKAAQQDVTNDNFTSFEVTAIGNNAVYFDNVTFTKATVWESATKYFWPAYALDFYAYNTPANGNGTFTRNITTTNPQTLTYSPAAELAKQEDLVAVSVTGKKESDNNVSGAIDLAFNHYLTQVIVKAKNSSSTYKVEVDGVKLANFNGKGTYTFSTETMIADGTKTDYKETINLVELSSTATEVMTDADNGRWYLVPQTVTAWDQAHELTNASEGTYLALKVKITANGGALKIYPATGDESAWMAIPIKSTDIAFAQGHKYTVTVDFFGKNGAGYVDPEDPGELDGDAGTSDAGKKIIGGEIKFSATVNEWTNESEITIQL